MTNRKRKRESGKHLLNRIRRFLCVPGQRVVIETDAKNVVYGPKDVGQFADADKLGVYIGDDRERTPCCFVHFARIALLYECECQRCGNKWQAEKIRTACPSCRSRVWNGRDDSGEDRRRGKWTRVRVGGSAEVPNV